MLVGCLCEVSNSILLLPLLCDSTELVTPASGSQVMFPGDMVNTLYSCEGIEVESPRKFPAPPKKFKTGKRLWWVTSV